MFWSVAYLLTGTRRELNLNRTMGERKAVVKNADMSNDMQEDAVHTAASAMDKYQVEKDVAAFVKKEFDRKYSPTWHCVVGKSFGRWVGRNGHTVGPFRVVRW